MTEPPVDLQLNCSRRNPPTHPLPLRFMSTPPSLPSPHHIFAITYPSTLRRRPSAPIHADSRPRSCCPSLRLVSEPSHYLRCHPPSRRKTAVTPLLCQTAILQSKLPTNAHPPTFPPSRPTYRPSPPSLLLFRRRVLRNHQPIRLRLSLRRRKMSQAKSSTSSPRPPRRPSVALVSAWPSSYTSS